ncbi:MAG: hypothetical protein VXY50_09050, partial [Verrucomicrobiota bacterium]|nr:hypothetical protein [Verrucomicrobiota bacterium]
MFIHKSFYFIIAAVFTAAIFLDGQQKRVSYLTGKVEIIDSEIAGPESISDLEINATILPKHILATGKGSRIALRQNDVRWRLGSLSVGRWFPNNSFWLHSGSALFCSSEDGDFTFSTREANATFSGSGTIIIEATANGGFKFIPLEAKGTIRTPKGDAQDVRGGRLLLVLGKPTRFGDAFDIDIMLLLKSSRLVNAFPDPLPTFDKIGLALYVQELKLKGKYDALIGDATTNENLQMWKFGKKPVKEA